MEVSVAIYIEGENQAWEHFIFSMWDSATRPISDDEVEEVFQEAYAELEFLDEPDVIEKLPNGGIAAYYDVLSSLSLSDEIFDPYLSMQLKQFVIVVALDEGEEWYRFDSGKITAFVPAKGKRCESLLESAINVGRAIGK